MKVATVMLKDSFLEYLRSERNCSALTVRSYAEDLTQFESFFESLDEGLTWEVIDADIVREWVVYLMDEHELETRSVNRKLSTLRTFFRYMMRMGVITSDPMRKVAGPKNKKCLPAFIKEKDMDRLFGLMSEDESFSGVRDMLVILMFYHTGMRRAELLGLRESDVDLCASQVKVTGKRDKQRIIPFGDELKDVALRYLAMKHDAFPVAGEKFFVDDAGDPLTEGKVGRIVKDCLLKVTSQGKRSPHVLRHSFATAMLNNKADLLAIQKLMGHESLGTTEVYTHLTFEELKNVYKDAHPRS